MCPVLGVLVSSSRTPNIIVPLSRMELGSQSPGVIVFQLVGINPLSVTPIEPAAPVGDRVQLSENVGRGETNTGDGRPFVSRVQHVIVSLNGLANGFVHFQSPYCWNG